MKRPTKFCERARQALVGVTIVSSTALGAPWLSPGGQATSPLERAEEAFLDKDFLSMNKSLHEALTAPDSDASAMQAASELLDKAYDATRGHLPSDWHLPPGLTSLDFKVNRRESGDGVVFSYQLGGDIVSVDTIKQLQLVRYPSELILDLAANVGTWETSPDGNGFSFDFQTKRQTQKPPADGLYTLSIELKDGTRTEGWFIATNMVSSASPRLSSPTAGATVNTPNPLMQWDEFQSPEHRPYEHCKIVAHVSVQNQANDLWSLYSNDTAMTSAIIGRDPAGNAQLQLADNSYWVLLGLLETKHFGDVRLARGSRTGLGMSVKTH